MAVYLRNRSIDESQKAILEARKQELISKGYWTGSQDKAPLSERPIIIKENKTHFILAWLQNMQTRAVRFALDENKNFSWCYQNGQAHSLDSLEELISDIYKHYAPELNS